MFSLTLKLFYANSNIVDDVRTMEFNRNWVRYVVRSNRLTK